MIVASIEIGYDLQIKTIIRGCIFANDKNYLLS